MRKRLQSLVIFLISLCWTLFLPSISAEKSLGKVRSSAWLKLMQAGITEYAEDSIENSKRAQGHFLEAYKAAEGEPEDSYQRFLPLYYLQMSGYGFETENSLNRQKRLCATMMLDLAEEYERVGDAKNADSFYSGALKLREEVGGKDSPMVAESLERSLTYMGKRYESILSGNSDASNAEEIKKWLEVLTTNEGYRNFCARLDRAIEIRRRTGNVSDLARDLLIRSQLSLLSGNQKVAAEQLQESYSLLSKNVEEATLLHANLLACAVDDIPSLIGGSMKVLPLKYCELACRIVECNYLVSETDSPLTLPDRETVSRIFAATAHCQIANGKYSDALVSANRAIDIVAKELPWLVPELRLIGLEVYLKQKETMAAQGCALRIRRELLSCDPYLRQLVSDRITSLFLEAGQKEMPPPSGDKI